MAFGMLAGLQPSEEERKKRREQFDNNRTNLGFGAKAGQGGLMGAGKLGQQAQLGTKSIPAPTPAQAQMQASVQAGRQARTQALAQVETDKLARAKKQNEVRAQAQSLVRLPVKEQAQAIEQLKVQAQPQTIIGAPPVAKTAPQLGIVPPPKPKPSPNLGIMNNPNAAKSVNVNDGTIAKEARAEQGIDDDIGTIGSDNIWKGNPDNKSFGLSITPTPDRDPLSDFAKATQSPQPNLGFNIPRAPMRSWSERQEREALLRDTSTAYKGSQNGQLTSSQMQLRAGIIGADDKYKNDQYNTQLGAASQVAQTQATQAGANARAALSEVGSNSRLNTQMGFDADKFQQTAAQQDQRLGLDSRRLDVEQANDAVKNFSAKTMNNLYEKYQAAETDDQKSAIAAQIRDLKGTALETENWTNIGGGEKLSSDGLTSTKNPDILLNRSTGETKEIPKTPVDFMRDPRAMAIIKNRDLSDEEMHAQLMALE